MEIKEFINSLTRAEVEKVANKDFTFLNGETLVALREAGLTQKQLATYAKEALKHIPNNEATIEEEIDPDKYWAEEQTQEPAQAQEQEEEIDEQKLYTEIEAVAPKQAGKKTTALSRLNLLTQLKELSEKHTNAKELVKEIKEVIAEQAEDESVTIQVNSKRVRSLSIRKATSIPQVLIFMLESAEKQLEKIESDIEALEF